MFESRNKIDLIIEVWEKLDCESVGKTEILAIETVVRDRFGDQAVDSPMITARLLADEGAELRHQEIMQLFLERAEDRPYDAVFRNILDVTSLAKADSSLRRMENLRRKFVTDSDKEGLRLLREIALERKQYLASDKGRSELSPDVAAEIDEWLRIWLGSPEVFEHWIKLRKATEGYKTIFGKEQ
ncbi:MAG: hypothetical protein KF685_11340 [Acidobacteria bacterium]|nr:hypothetical protein [Acidobacteriota bacterium]